MPGTTLDLDGRIVPGYLVHQGLPCRTPLESPGGRPGPHSAGRLLLHRHAAAGPPPGAYRWEGAPCRGTAPPAGGDIGGAAHDQVAALQSLHGPPRSNRPPGSGAQSLSRSASQTVFPSLPSSNETAHGRRATATVTPGLPLLGDQPAAPRPHGGTLADIVHPGCRADKGGGGQKLLVSRPVLRQSRPRQAALGSGKDSSSPGSSCFQINGAHLEHRARMGFEGLRVSLHRSGRWLRRWSPSAADAR